MLSSRQGIQIGEVAGHVIKIDPIAFGILTLYALYSLQPIGAGIAFVLAAFVAILVHELGHALTIGRLLRAPSEVVIGFGGVTWSNAWRSARHQFLISIAGPIAGFALGLVVWGVAQLLEFEKYGPWPWDFGYYNGPPWILFLSFVIWMSAAWGILNLLPAVPLDGGQALRALLIDRGMQQARARRITRRIGLFVAVAGGVYFLQHGMMVGAMVMLWIAITNYEETRVDGW